jgi:hypothetical protein
MSSSDWIVLQKLKEGGKKQKNYNTNARSLILYLERTALMMNFGQFLLDIDRDCLAREKNVLLHVIEIFRHGRDNGCGNGPVVVCIFQQTKSMF